MERPKHLTWEESGLLHADARHGLSHAVRPSRRTSSSPATTCWCGAPRAASACSACSSVAASGANAIGIMSDRVQARIRHGSRRQGRHQPQGFQMLGPDAQGRHARIRRVDQGSAHASARRSGTSPASSDVDIVFEHPGEATFPVSCLVVKRGGMVVFCAGTTGFNITFDARYVWMRQKRIQGSHFAHLKQASAANQFVIDRRVDPCMWEVFPWDKIPLRPRRCGRTSISPATWRCWSTRRARVCAISTTWSRRRPAKTPIAAVRAGVRCHFAGDSRDWSRRSRDNPPSPRIADVSYNSSARRSPRCTTG